MKENCKAAFARIHADLEDYYARWYHERPMAILPARRDELRELHRVLYKCIAHIAERFEDYVPRFMPLSDREMRILRMQSEYPFRAGTFRPDYLVSEDGELRLCEITSRFFAHGIFLSYFSERVADLFMAKHPGCARETVYEELLETMRSLADGRDEIWVLKSADKTSEIRLYAPFYRHFGKRVEILEAGDVERNIDQWRKGLVFSALNQRDLLSFSDDTLRAMMDAGMVNDFRTILLIHDKRFMSLWYEDAFTDRCLTPEETAFLRRHAIPTWTHGSYADEWEDARVHREGYILKHHRLGKSEKVYAGSMTDAHTWQALWDGGDVRDMILQPFLSQRSYPTVWEGTPFRDYICGMMLCVNDLYFDSGVFRASSLPVTNVGDDRKICPIHTDDPAILAESDIL